MTRIVAIFACLALTGCVAAKPPENRAVGTGASVTLGVGEAASIQGTPVSLRFVGVIEDSRCPSDTTCVWAGEVKVQLEFLERGKDPRPVELKLNESTNAAERTVTLMQVEPHPRSNVRIAANGYRATLKLE